jgi:hypothetical protein
MLAATAEARAPAAFPEEETTLLRELHTSRAWTHVPVGYCWQNSRCCRLILKPQHNYIGDFVSHRSGELAKKLTQRIASRELMLRGEFANYTAQRGELAHLSDT